MSRIIRSNSQQITSNINFNEESKRITRAVNMRRNVTAKRVALAVSNKQNKIQIVAKDIDEKAADNLKVRETVTVGCKTNKIVVNDENADIKCSTTCVNTRSKIPIDVSKQIAGTKVAKCKPTARLTSDEESESHVEMSYSTNLLPLNVENIDINDVNNVFLTPDYVNEIYSYLRHLENTQNVKNNFLSAQREMTPRMRSVLIDWLINVHNQFRLLPETLYLAVSLMDRFFQNEIVSKDKIQLVGVTAFFIASKFEEIYPPDIKDFVLICDQLYHKKDIIKMEMTILRVLKFELGRPLPLHFLRRNSKAAHADSKIHSLAKYLMELTLVEYECAHWNPSLLAATSLYVTLRMLGDSPKWTPTLEYYSNYSEQELIPCASLLCKIVKKADKSKFQNCRKKYATSKFLEISKLPELKSSIIDQIAAIQS